MKIGEQVMVSVAGHDKVPGKVVEIEAGMVTVELDTAIEGVGRYVSLPLGG